MYITKKDLLQETGISYGQLYRWKREGLIPEEWFIKKASRTGQETYLPRNQIIERIRFINEHKAECSLEELSRLLSMQTEYKEFNKELLRQIHEIHPDIIKSVMDGEYSRAEVAFLVIVSAVYKKYRLNRQEINELLAGCADYFTDFEKGRHIFWVCRGFGKVFGMVTKEGQNPLFDKRITVLECCQIEEIAGALAMKYLKREAEPENVGQK